jgi:transposase InsO family protein
LVVRIRLIIKAVELGAGELEHLVDHGAHSSREFAALAADCQVELSHGRTGKCWDNALAESFFGSIKGELLDLQSWPTKASARRAVTEYIGWYNGTRLHSALGYQTPAEFEANHHNTIKNVA